MAAKKIEEPAIGSCVKKKAMVVIMRRGQK